LKEGPGGTWGEEKGGLEATTKKGAARKRPDSRRLPRGEKKEVKQRRRLLSTGTLSG